MASRRARRLCKAGLLFALALATLLMLQRHDRAKQAAKLAKAEAQASAMALQEAKEAKAEFDRVQAEEDQAAEEAAAALVLSRTEVKRLEHSVRLLKAKGTVMEQDPDALVLIAQLQAATKILLVLEYGHGDSQGTYRVDMDIEFPSQMPDNHAHGRRGRIIIETGPRDLVPHSVKTFLEMVKHWEQRGGGAFHRNAGHVCQAQVSSRGEDRAEGLAFQEYHRDFPHQKHTLGYAGRPGGPAFYISTIDNTYNHGPGSQGSKTEADGCFGRVVGGVDVVDRLAKVWGKTQHGFQADRMGFLAKQEEQVKIVALQILRE